MVFSRDWLAQKDKFVSYGLCNLPSTAGAHRVTCETWYGVESNNSMGRRFFGTCGGGAGRGGGAHALMAGWLVSRARTGRSLSQYRSTA